MRRLGDLLLERGLISDQDFAAAEAIQREVGGGIGPTLVRIGALSEDALLGVLSEQIGLPILDPASAPPIEAVRKAVHELGAPLAWFIDNEVIAWRTQSALIVAGPRLHDPAVQEAVEQWHVPDARLFLASSLALEPLLSALRGRGEFSAAATDPARLMELAEEAPVIDFVNSVLAEAIALRASDVHFEPFEDNVSVRLRVDGVLLQRRTAAREMFDAIASRIKLLSRMDIAERRLPQDGRQTIRVAGRDIDVRVSTLPTRWGESIVVRLLGATHAIPEMDALGLTPSQRAIITETLAIPNGLVLITGPTGSGKTTSVYRLISQLNDGVRKIVTIEDPVEFDLPGVLQMTVRADIELDFATGLRSILRQDPDVIFVGEIRDSETARTAVQAALTGHLVISTVHTNSALAAIARLVDLGVEKFLLADVLRAVVGQRLVRRVCGACAAPERDPNCEQQAQRLLPPTMREGLPAWRRGAGCKVCGGSGFQGRIGVFEAARIDAPMQQAIRAGASEAELVALARARGFTDLLQNGLAKARAGQTAFLEALRVLGAALMTTRRYHYRALDASGATVSDSVQADSRADALRRLARERKTVLDLREPSEAGERSGPARVSHDQGALALRQLAVMTRAGVELLEALEIIAASLPGPIAEALRATMVSLRQGERLAKALQQNAAFYPTYVYALIRAGEASGRLPLVLEEAARQLAFEQRVRRDIQNALVYPAFLVASGALSVGFLFYVVVPRFADMLQNARAELSGLSAFVINAGVGFHDNFLLILLAASLAAIGVAAFISTGEGKRTLSELSHATPGLNTLLQTRQRASWSRIMAIALAAGVDVLEATTLAAGALPAGKTKLAALAAINALRSGRPVDEAFLSSQTLSIVDASLIRAGQRSGAMAEMFRAVADRNDEEMRDALEALHLGPRAARHRHRCIDDRRHRHWPGVGAGRHLRFHRLAQRWTRPSPSSWHARRLC